MAAGSALATSERQGSLHQSVLETGREGRGRRGEGQGRRGRGREGEGRGREGEGRAGRRGRGRKGKQEGRKKEMEGDVGKKR